MAASGSRDHHRVSGMRERGSCVPHRSGTTNKTMPNGRDEPYCRNCTSWAKGPRSLGHCSRHEFIMPALDDLVICRDWQPAFRTAGIPPFVGALGSGVLYRWEPYDPNPPKAVGRFEQLKEFRLDRRWKLYENPTNGWSVQVGSWEHELFPAPGEPLKMHLDKLEVPFAVRDAPVTTTHASRSATGELQMEDRAETKRILLPAQGH